MQGSERPFVRAPPLLFRAQLPPTRPLVSCGAEGGPTTSMRVTGEMLLAPRVIASSARPQRFKR